MKAWEERFFSFVHHEPNTGCWLWSGAPSRDGYGTFHFTSRLCSPAHRVSYELHVAPIPEGLFVCHRCDVPACVNPAHLFVGTHDDNMADKVAKGRQTKGEQQPHARLTSRHAEVIRKLTGWGVLRQQDIAALFGVSRTTISYIHTGRLWKSAKAEAAREGGE